MLWGVGLLAFGAFFLGGRIEPQRKVREKKRSYYQAKLKELAENPDRGERLLNLHRLTSYEHSMEQLEKAHGDPNKAARIAAEELKRAREQGLI